MKRFIISCMIVCILLFTIGLATIFSGCGPVLDPENPIFRLEVDLPVNEKTTAAELTVQPGMQVVVPATIVSTRDEPVEVSLDIDREKEFPEDITITVPEGNISVPTGERVTVDIVCYVGETVAPGLYHTHLIGTLSEPIEGQAGIARAIDIIVTDQPQETSASLPRNGKLI